MTTSLNYEEKQTHTWELKEKPPLSTGGEMREFSAAWTVTGSGSRQPVATRGAAVQPPDTWTIAVRDDKAPLTVWELPGQKKLSIASRHGVHVAHGAVKVSAQGAGALGGLSGDINEWEFPKQDFPLTQATLTGASMPRTFTDNSRRPGWQQPLGATVTETCEWNFTRLGQTSTRSERGASPSGLPTTAVPSLDRAAVADERAAARAAAGSPSASSTSGGPTATTGATLTAVCTMSGPTHLRVARATPGGVYLLWDAAPGATGYDVGRSDVGALTRTPITATQFTNKAALDYRVSYGYSVTANYAQGCGTSTVSAQPSQPGIARLVSVTTGNGNPQTHRGQVTLKWTLPLTDATQFIVSGPGVEAGAVVPIAPLPPPDQLAAFLQSNANAPPVEYKLDIDVPPGKHTWLITPVWIISASERFSSTDVAQQVTATVGFFRVLITGLRAVSETFDDQVFDGLKDEIYVGAAAYFKGDIASLARTEIYGDTNKTIAVPPPGFPVPTRQNRLTAGSASPLGGIQAGDTLPPGEDPAMPSSNPSNSAFPLVVWEGWMGGNTTVQVNPSIWEYDADRSAFNDWQTLMLGVRPTAPPVELIAADLDASPRTPREPAAYQLIDADKINQALDKAAQSLAQTYAATNGAQGGGGGSSGGLRDTSGAAAQAAASTRSADAAALGANSTPLSNALAFNALVATLVANRPGYDRFIGQIFAAPPLALTSTSGMKVLTFKDPVVPLVPLLGEYKMYITVVPAPLSAVPTVGR